MPEPKMPKRMYVAEEQDGDIRYYVADDSPKGLAAMHDVRCVGEYELKRVVNLRNDTVVEPI